MVFVVVVAFNAIVMTVVLVGAVMIMFGVVVMVLLVAVAMALVRWQRLWRGGNGVVLHMRQHPILHSLPPVRVGTVLRPSPVFGNEKMKKR